MTARRLTQLAALGAIALATLAGCGAGGRERAAAARPRAGDALVASLPGPHLGTSISALVSRLSPWQLAGERLIFSYEGLQPPSSLLEQIREGSAGGVILFSSNISTEAQLTQATDALQGAAMESPVKLPLPILVDQEGGLVRRLPGAPAQSEKQIGQAAAPVSAAIGAGRGAALTLRSVGANVNLAPVLAVSRSHSGLIERDERSYSSDAVIASELGAAFIAASQQLGVAATAKHFPGLGAAGNGNTDTEPVKIGTSLSELREVDEAPFAAAISAGVRLIMVSWATYDALDPSRPAGLSSKVVEGELRRRLRFDGVTITDALNAGALRAYGSSGQRAVLAAKAGMDMILCAGHTPREGEAVREALNEALQYRALQTASAVASVERIVALRRSLELNRRGGHEAGGG